MKTTSIRTWAEHVLPMFCACSFHGHSMDNLFSYCGSIDAKIRASDKDLPVLSGTETIGHFLLDFLVIHKINIFHTRME